MANKKQDNTEYLALKAAVSGGQLGKLYIFQGEEKFLQEYYLGQIRKRLVGDDFDGFNYKRFEGSINLDELSAACDTLPAFADRTLIEVHDYDMFKANDEIKQKLINLLSDLPDYVCLIFIFDVINYDPDGRMKLAVFLKKEAKIVEFNVQEQAEIVKWIKKHFNANKKKISTPDAEYLAFSTGGLLTTLNVEIEKISSYTKEEIITREHIDALVTPVLDAVSWKLTDHLINGDYDSAAAVLTDLLNMKEPPHKLLFSVSMKFRQLMAARICADNGLGEKKLIEICSVKLRMFDFQARDLLKSARRTTLSQCRDWVILCSAAAYRMNTGGDPENLLTELLIRLAVEKRGARSC